MTLLFNTEKNNSYFVPDPFRFCAVCQQRVAVNYNMNDYLPEDSSSTVALNVMESEFNGGIPNARVMIDDVTLSEALDYKEKLENIDGVSSVTWVDDTINIKTPLEMQTAATIETYYKDNNALFSVTIEEDKTLDAVSLDYSVFLIHRFEESRAIYETPEEAIFYCCFSRSTFLYAM